MADAEYDYVVVGAGSAGCVVAARLSESGAYSVALLEAGSEDDSFWIHLPVGYSKLYDSPDYNWLYESEPEEGLAQARSFQPRGRVLGGSGSINGNVYQRGTPQDFDHWRQLGNTGWSYEDVLPFFRKAEDNENDTTSRPGERGPMRVSNVERDELSEAFLAAAVEAGYPRIPSFNGNIQEGFAYNQITLRNGRRCSTATAYIRPARRRRNLDVIVEAVATRILLKDGKAHKVEYRRDGLLEAVTARREIVVSSGVFNSPHLLQRSGIGPAELLRRFDVPVVANVPGVGENLQDHIGVGMTYECARPITINDTVNNPVRLSLAVAKYALFRKGLLASTPVPSAGLIRTDPSVAEPDVKLQLRNWNRSASGRKKERMGLVALSSFGVAVHLMHPTSRGTVRLKSKDENAPPEIRFNFFTSERDRHSAIVGQRETRKLMSMPAMRPYVVRELTPGAEFQSDDELVEHFRKRAISGHHATGSCRMGIDDLAAIDPRLRVRGVEGLRVIDASVMPRQVAANTNATTIMIAEKGAAMILEDAKAPARLSASVV